MKLFKYTFLLLVLMSCMACQHKTLPNGFYINDAGDAYKATAFEVRGDTLLWKANYQDTIAKVFTYTISGNELEGVCTTTDEHLKRNVEITSDGIILNQQIFKSYDPTLRKLPEGEYVNSDDVPSFEMHLQVKGDSLILQSYRYGEFLYRFASHYEIVSPSKIKTISEAGDKGESVFQFFHDGFVIAETRYVKVRF